MTTAGSRLLLALVCMLMWAAPALAEQLDGGLGLVSDKVVRGVSQSGAQPSVLLDLVYRTDTQWSVGLGIASLGLGGWADNRRSSRSDWEVNLVVARSWQLNADWAAQVSGTAYGYPGSRDPFYDDYLEVSASANWRGALSIAVAAAPKFSGVDRAGRRQRGTTGTLEFGAHAPLGGRWAVDAGLGWHDAGELGRRPYAFGSVGVSWRPGKTQVFLTWITSRTDELNGVNARIAGNRTVLSLWQSF